MFLRSSVSAFAQYVRKPILLSRTIHTSYHRYLCSEVKVPKVNEDKRVTLIFKKTDGRIIEVKARVNESILDAIDDLDPYRDEFSKFGQCGGKTSCSTCHVILNEKDFHKLPPANESEENLVELALRSPKFSRLGCNILVTEEMEGMIFNLPPEVENRQREDVKKINQS